MPDTQLEDLMLKSLELGRAGTEEWLAASKNLTLSDESFSGFTCLTGWPIVGLFTKNEHEDAHKNLSGSPEPLENSK